MFSFGILQFISTIILKYKRVTGMGNAANESCLSVLYLRYYRTSWIFASPTFEISTDLIYLHYFARQDLLKQSLVKIYNHWRRHPIIGLHWILVNSLHFSIFASLSYFARTLFSNFYFASPYKAIYQVFSVAFVMILANSSWYCTLAQLNLIERQLLNQIQKQNTPMTRKHSTV